MGEQADGCRAAEVRSADVAAGRARLTRFPNLEQIKDPEDRKLRIAEAEAAVGLLSYIIKDYEADLAEAEKQIAAIQARAAQAAALRRFNDDLESVKSKFIELQKETDVHRRGYAFESLLADVFLLYDLEPRLAYTIPLETNRWIIYLRHR